jgi:hypothetical protein
MNARREANNLDLMTACKLGAVRFGTNCRKATPLCGWLEKGRYRSSWKPGAFASMGETEN